MSGYGHTPPNSGAGSRRVGTKKAKGSNDGAGEDGDLIQNFESLLSPPEGDGGLEDEAAKFDSYDEFESDDEGMNGGMNVNDVAGILDDGLGDLSDNEGRAEEELAEEEHKEEELAEEERKEEEELAGEEGKEEESALRRSDRLARPADVVPAAAEADVAIAAAQLPEGAGGEDATDAPTESEVTVDELGRKIVIHDNAGRAEPMMIKWNQNDEEAVGFVTKKENFWGHLGVYLVDQYNLISGVIPPEGKEVELGSYIYDVGGNNVTSFFLFPQQRLALRNGVGVEDGEGDWIRDTWLSPQFFPLYSIGNSARRSWVLKLTTIVAMNGGREAGVLTVCEAKTNIGFILARSKPGAGTTTMTITNRETGRPLKIKVRDSEDVDGPERMTEAGSNALPRPYLWCEEFPGRSDGWKLSDVAKRSAKEIAETMCKHPLLPSGHFGKVFGARLGELLGDLNYIIAKQQGGGNRAA